MTEGMMDLIMTVLAAIATGAIAVGVAFLQSRIRSERTGEALGRLGEVAQITVGELQQTLVKGWKEAGGGKLTSAQVEALKRASQTKIMEKMDEPAVALLEAVGADIEGLIAGFVEDAVGRLKSGM